MRIKKGFLTVATIMAFTVCVGSAYATTIAELQAQLKVLMAQLASMQTGTSTAAPLLSTGSAQANGAAACPNLSRNLTRGSRDTDVTQLQQFLVSQKLLATDAATGLFGPLTEAAVKKFQCKTMNLCAGSPASNGYGAVGARTRVAITASCKWQPLQPQQPQQPVTTAKPPTSTPTPQSPSYPSPTVNTPQTPTPESKSVQIAPLQPAVTAASSAPIIRRCNVFRYAQDIYMGILDDNGERQFDLRLGSAGVISSLRGPDFQELLAKSFSGERTDRVVQWVVWGKSDLHSLTGPGAKESSEWYTNMFNVNQSGGMSDLPNAPSLQETLWVEGNSANCTVDIYAAPARQWYSQLDAIFSAKFQSLTRYTITQDRAFAFSALSLCRVLSMNFELIAGHRSASCNSID
jgi:peptidoglycan hydrolase-like protein with peptidoglycan-binding domain